MNHPKEEDLLLYFYGECDQQARSQVKQHINHCHECSQRLADWGAASEQLDQWELPINGVSHSKVQGSVTSPGNKPQVAHRQGGPVNAMVVIGIAAMIVIGFVIGRLTSPGLDRDDIGAMIDQRLIAFTDAKELHGAFEQQMERRDKSLKELIKKQQALIAQANKGGLSNEQAKELQGVLGQIVIQQSQLRDDLETLAINAETKINENRSNLNELIRRTSLEP